MDLGKLGLTCGVRFAWAPHGALAGESKVNEGNCDEGNCDEEIWGVAPVEMYIYVYRI